jgi:hypothetical protein
MQKTKKIHQKSNTKHGKKRKVRTIKRAKKNIRGYDGGVGLLGNMQYPLYGSDKNSGYVKQMVDDIENGKQYKWSDGRSPSRPSSIGSELTMNSKADTIPPPTNTKLSGDNVASQTLPVAKLPSELAVKEAFSPPFQTSLANVPIMSPSKFVVEEGFQPSDQIASVNDLPNSSGSKATFRVSSEGDFQPPLPISSAHSSQQDVRGLDVDMTEGVPVSPLVDELPPGYEKKQAPDGNWYYVNHNDGTTSWTPPVLNSSGLRSDEATFGISSEEAGSLLPQQPLPMVDTTGIVDEPAPMVQGLTESGTIYIVRYRNSNGAISEKEVFKHIDTNPGTYTRYVFDGYNNPLKCNIPIFDIGDAVKKRYEPNCEEISLAPLGITR